MAVMASFADHLQRLAPVTAVERAALDRLHQRERQLRRGAVLQRESDPGREMFLLATGCAMSSVLLDDGRRQVLRFHFPGELLGLSNLVYRRGSETITLLCASTVRPVDPAAFAQVLAAHPRLALLAFAASQIERTELTDRLAGLGRTSARSRVAAMLVAVRDQLRRTDAGVADSFALGLTQEEIGDATGLTAVHVNRMLRQLEDEGLIAREAKRGMVTFRDEERLLQEANYLDRRADLDLGWLPPPAD